MCTSKAIVISDYKRVYQLINTLIIDKVVYKINIIFKFLQYDIYTYRLKASFSHARVTRRFTFRFYLHIFPLSVVSQKYLSQNVIINSIEKLSE